MDSFRDTGSVDVRLDATDATGSGMGNSSSGSTGDRNLGDWTPAVFVRLRIALGP